MTFDPASVLREEPLQLSQRDLATGLIHLYRGEVSRQNAWRSRMDVTTNWALIATGTALTFAFGSGGTHHSVILLDSLLVTLFLFIEARGYCYFDIWSYRVRLLEANFYGASLAHTETIYTDWQARLAASLIRPRFMVTLWEALGRRLRRTYLWIYVILDLAWFAKLLLMSGEVLTVGELTRRSAMGVIPGPVVMLVVLLVNVLLIGISIYTLRLRAASTEVMEYGPAPE